jgi:mono/diheme cytochrome c family protein
MPAQSTNLKDEEIWDVVNYITALPYMEQAEGSTSSGHKSGG